MDGGSNGLFSSDCTVNPHFCNASMFHFNYCDGASFAGHADAPVPVAGREIYFRGRDVLDASIAALLRDEGMSDATAVMVRWGGVGGGGGGMH